MCKCEEVGLPRNYTRITLGVLEKEVCMIIRLLLRLSCAAKKLYESFLLSLCPNIDIIPDEEIWRYYIFLFVDSWCVSTVEHYEYAA